MKIDGDVLEAIERSNTVGLHLYLPGQMDRKMYLRVNKALELAGGKWHRGHKAHIFGVPAEEAIEQMVLTGEVVDAKREFDAFYTPPELAKLVCDMAEVKAGQWGIEPSCGAGAILDETRRRGALMDAYEIRPDVATAAGADCADFMQIEPGDEPGYDFVAMNPPFSKRQDVRHVNHALGFLRPGGRLVAIMSAGITFREDSPTRELRGVIRDGGGRIEALPEAAFKASGTMVNAVLVSVRR